MTVAKGLVRAMAVYLGLLGTVALTARGGDDPLPADLSKPRLTAAAAGRGKVQDAERKNFDKFLRDTNAAIIVIEGTPNVVPPAGAKPVDSEPSAWTRASRLRPWLQKADVQPFKGDPIRVKVVVGPDDWTLDAKDLRRLVRASVAAQAEGKPIPRVDYLYPPELAPLQKAYEAAIRGGNTKIEGNSDRFLLIELPKKTARMIDAMLFYGFDALFVRSDPGAWNVALVEQRLKDLEQAIQMYFTLQITGLVDPYVLGEMGWKEWTLPTPRLDRDKVIQAFFKRDHPDLRAEQRSSFSTKNGGLTVIEIGGGKHFQYTRFVAPVDEIPAAAMTFFKEGKFPVKQPEYYFTSRWWFTNVVWQMAHREHRYIDFDPKTFIHGHPRMAWYPIQYLQFGPP